MRYRLRTLLIALALGPPALAWSVWELRRASEIREKNRADEEFRKAVMNFERKMQPGQSYPEFANSPPY